MNRLRLVWDECVSSAKIYLPLLYIRGSLLVHEWKNIFYPTSENIPKPEIYAKSMRIYPFGIHAKQMEDTYPYSVVSVHLVVNGEDDDRYRKGSNITSPHGIAYPFIPSEYGSEYFVVRISNLMTGETRDTNWKYSLTTKDDCETCFSEGVEIDEF